MGNLISYVNLLSERDRFRKSGGAHSSEFGLYDTPTHKYFKVFFYFDNGDVTGEQSLEAGNGLLAPTWLIDGLDDTNYYLYNSAWSYLTMNNDDQRAEWLKDFVNLLSNISSEAPWYFSEMTGLESAVERKAVMEENFTVNATRPKIALKCLQDATDDRIGTLLDLYRSIVWDWKSKRMVLPANLRKFDMGILIFETPTNDVNMHDVSDVDRNNRVFDNMLAANSNKASYKYYELHNCEIDYNSTKGVVSQLNNKEGTSPEYTIDIHFDDCYETRYNKFLSKELGDFIFLDLDQTITDSQQGDAIPSQPMQMNIPGNATGDPVKFEHELLPDHAGSANPTPKSHMEFQHHTLPDHPGSPDLKKGWLAKVVDQLIQTGADWAVSKLKRAVMGNLYTFSLTRIGDQLTTLANGDILSTARNAAEYIRDAKQRKANQLTNLNVFRDDKVFVTAKEPMGTLSGNTPQGPVSPMTGVSLKPDNINANFSLVGDVGKLNEGPQTSHYSQMSDINNINEKPVQSLYTNSQNIGRIPAKKRIIPKVKYIGNLYEGNTIADNL